MSPFDEDPNDSRTEIDLCIEEIAKLQAELGKKEDLIKIHKEMIESGIKKVGELQTELEKEKADLKRGCKAWKALYCELKTRLEKITEAWNSEIKTKSDSICIGEIHYITLPEKKTQEENPK